MTRLANRVLSFWTKEKADAQGKLSQDSKRL